MKRRAFIAALGGAAAWPLVARAQQSGRTYRLGFLIPSGRKSPWVLAFLDELRLNGFIEGQNLTIIPGGFDVQVDLLAERAEAMVKAEPDAIVGGPEPQLRALQARTGTIPLIGMTNDMVAEGLVKSLARPGGNTTGISLLSPELDGKRQEILMEAVPGARRMAALGSNVTPTHIQALQDEARLRGIELLVFAVAKPEDIAPAVDAAKAAGAEALNFLASGLFFPVNRIDIERATAARLPAIHHWPEAAEAGGLLGYGPRFNQVWRQRARLTIKILRGNKPADLPVEQPTNFELAINLQAAKGLGLTIPPSLLARADEVIE
jgi:putative tryptophan/tyrosine transport system substrate-binding protein